MRISIVSLTLILTGTAGTAFADSPLRSEKLKIASCESIAHDYHGYGDDIDEIDCVRDNSFTVVDTDFSEEINRTTYLKVVVKGPDEVCIVEHRLQAKLEGNSIKYYWTADTLACDYEGVENELLAELRMAIENNGETIWGGEVDIDALEIPIEEYMEDLLEGLSKERDENPDMDIISGGSNAIAELIHPYLLGGCSSCKRALEKIKKSGTVVDGVVYTNGMDEDYLTTRAELILKDGSVFSVYFGN